MWVGFLSIPSAREAAISLVTVILSKVFFSESLLGCLSLTDSLVRSKWAEKSLCIMMHLGQSVDLFSSQFGIGWHLHTLTSPCNRKIYTPNKWYKHSCFQHPFWKNAPNVIRLCDSTNPQYLSHVFYIPLRIIGLAKRRLHLWQFDARRLMFCISKSKSSPTRRADHNCQQRAWSMQVGHNCFQILNKWMTPQQKQQNKKGC